ncbi:MAG: UDP-N-acetylmuramoyl-tripeptide--D-alanyl-D-alanine ligase [Candidatus Hydrogenedentes bacterium]|nr:UDP-N-acetylmuramoyl-tripeptide--D-alanyl-D-alanine ligase [Candidatus Hydrogenedentota bacterium]
MPWEYTLKEFSDVVGGYINCDGSQRFSGVSIDTRKIYPGQIFFAFPGAKVDGHSYVEEAIKKGAPAVVVTKDVSVPHIKVDNTLRALQNFARWHRNNYPVKVFALTGSCGKTTSKEIITALLRQKYKVVSSHGNYNNEIGCPLSLLEIDISTDWAVIEMGAGKPGDIAELCAIAYPDESTVTVVGPAHLEKLHSVANVAIEKMKIAEVLPPWGHFYVNSDNKYILDIAKSLPVSKTYYGTNGDVVLKSLKVVSEEKMEMDVEPVGKLIIPLCSSQNVYNFLLAIAVSLRHGIQVDETVLLEAYNRVGRIKILDIHDLHVIDDSYNANPLSMFSAIEYLSLKAKESFKCAVLGDMLELGNEAKKWHFEVGREVGKKRVNTLFLYGEYSDEVAEGARETGVNKIYRFDCHKDIADAIKSEVPQGAWILIKGSRGMKMEKVIEYLKSE